MAVQDEIKIQVSNINQKSNNKMSGMLCKEAIFAKKNACLVSRIVSFDTTGLCLLTFRVLESYLSKYIDLDFSHAISH